MSKLTLTFFLLLGIAVYAIAGPLKDSTVASKVRGYSSAYTPTYSSPYEASYPTYTTYPWIKPCAEACAGCLYCYQQYNFYYPYGLDILYCNNFDKYCPAGYVRPSPYEYSSYSRGPYTSSSSYATPTYSTTYSPISYATYEAPPMTYYYPEWYLECYQWCFECLLCNLEYGFYYIQEPTPTPYYPSYSSSYPMYSSYYSYSSYPSYTTSAYSS
ncbi:hypothetical protein GAYE_SCF06G2759 [Galdieria yellowstonensis]|uniref:Uncharacterized protein n=1 Tax=Galdieria yellowstonensis TaxID=3028027 RepID=A0AAV9I6Z5_9RHOD|nr:hypothetical protein GAYE_HTGSCF06PCTG21G0344 [Galdieria yellowstonensis]KAK4524857.1 hypothetical protein GAYE_SCF06G2759 [Galdieria yellowstonensis]